MEEFIRTVTQVMAVVLICLAALVVLGLCFKVELDRLEARVAALEADLEEVKEANAYWYELFLKLGVLPERPGKAPLPEPAR